MLSWLRSSNSLAAESCRTPKPRGSTSRTLIAYEPDEEKAAVLNEFTMTNRRRNRTIGTLCLVAITGLSFAVASGFSKSEAAPAPAKDAPAQVAGAAKLDKDQYTVEMKTSGACSAGKECKAEITLAAKGDFHVNDKYPLKFKAADPAPEGLTFTKAVVKREDGKFEEKKGSLPVAFTVAKAGKVKVGGTLSFSVCSDATCMMDKVDLEVEVEAK
jgi:hypothetical protein